MTDVARWVMRKGLTHSSSTKNRQDVSSILPVEIRSSSRPGVPTTISTCVKGFISLRLILYFFRYSLQFQLLEIVISGTIYFSYTGSRLLCVRLQRAPRCNEDFLALKSLKAMLKLSDLRASTCNEQFLSQNFLLDVSETQCSFGSFT